jgi:hypothetical protein
MSAGRIEFRTKTPRAALLIVMVRRAACPLVFAAAVLACLPSAARAHAARGLVAAGSTPTRPFGDGVRLAFAATPQRIVSRDPRLHRSTTFAFVGGCVVAGAETGVALVTCELPRDAADGGRAGYQQAYVLSLASGRHRSIATRDGQPAGLVPGTGGPGFHIERYDVLGRQWLHAATGTENCYHCESEEFVNWHTGERRVGASFPTLPLPVDLDDPACDACPPARWQRRGRREWSPPTESGSSCRRRAGGHAC